MEPTSFPDVTVAMLLLVAALTLASASGISFWEIREVEDPDLIAAASAVVAFRGGTGFVASSDGLVVTANHVAEMVGDATWVRVGWTGEEPFPVRAVKVAADAHADLALFRLPDGEYPFISTRRLPAEKNEPVAMLAHPPGESVRASYGRILEAPTTWAGQPILEYDAPAYNGYSGGPLVDLQGRVLGVHRGWDFRTIGHGHLVAVPAGTLETAFPRHRFE